MADVDRGAGAGPAAGRGGLRASSGLWSAQADGARAAAPGVRRSLPNMATSLLLHEPAKLYPYHLLLITNYRLPPDVDRLNLEVSRRPGAGALAPSPLTRVSLQRHLSDAEFEAILQVGRQDFYRLPQWRRNELKRRARLF